MISSIDLRRGWRFYEWQQEALGDYFQDSLFSDIDPLVLYAEVVGDFARGEEGAKRSLTLRIREFETSESGRSHRA